MMNLEGALDLLGESAKTLQDEINTFKMKDTEYDDENNSIKE